MNKDIRAAMLGDHETAKRLTDAGVLLPCPMCGGEVRLRRVSSSYTTSPTTIMDKWTVECPNGCVRNNVYESKIFQDEKVRSSSRTTEPMKPASPGTPAHRF